MTPDEKHYRTKSGRILTDADIEALADEVEATEYSVDDVTPRRGRPPLGRGPAEVVPVRLDPELRDAVTARAAAEDTSTSDIIRRALRAFLDVA
ncbi:MAG TPA: CopG family transcriptional regulator [Acidimicrobiales bacterium]|mgnify:FL=1|nr:CopG family transcriptional regulator [Acidimicrobiales bacterium]